VRRRKNEIKKEEKQKLAKQTRPRNKRKIRKSTPTIKKTLT